MCGIIAYIGSKHDGIEVVINGLKKLEYRGYDSWGIASKDGGAIRVHKQVGKVGGIEIDDIVQSISFSGNDARIVKSQRLNVTALRNGPRNQLTTNLSICIGHTRWATHGGVTEANAHPHLSCDGSIAVVHNGIIENYQELRKELELKGHKFKSETDTEVIAHLIEEYLSGRNVEQSKRLTTKSIPHLTSPNLGEENSDSPPKIEPVPDHACRSLVRRAGPIGEGVRGGMNDFIQAARSAIQRLEGGYALAIINNKDNIMIGARKGSPLILGVSGGGYFLASDIPAFIDHTKNVVYLDEEEMVVIEKNPKTQNLNPKQEKSGSEIEHQILNINTGNEVKRKVAKIDWSAEEAQKGGFDHYLIKEITEQPNVIRATLQIADADIQKAISMIGRSRDIFIVACGTAMHAGMVGQYLFSEICGRQAHLISAAEFPYFYNLLSPKDLVITVSQSGETADVMEAVRSTKKQGAKILALVNVMGSSLMRAADFSILTKAGPEICVLSTKAYSSQVATLLLLAYTLASRQNEAKKLLLEASEAIKNNFKKSNLARLKDLANSISKKSDFYLIGRGMNYPTALEAALKIKEVSYIHAEGFAGGDLKHGPIALIEQGTPCFVFAASDSSEKDIMGNAMEVKARGGLIIGIAPKNNEVFHHHLPVADIPELSPILNIIPTQLLAYYLSLVRGTDPDKPRNLAKSVTVK